MALIKSYSNYTLKKRHQEINGGTIYERDITTVGGLDTFGSGQVPVYKSGNFLITVRNDGRVTNQYNRGNWEESVSGNVWTLEKISGMTSELEDDNDLKIVLKQDYYDLSDFAYYGSLTELFRASVNDIVSRFPGELYGTRNNVYCTSAFTEDGETIQTSVVLGSENCYEISNPFGINIHTVTIPKDVDRLKYFADSGFTQYELISGETTSPITQWDVEYYYSEEVGKGAYKKYTAKYSSESGKISISEGEDPLDRPYPCKGDVAAIIKLNNTYEISGYVGDNGNIFYLYSGDTCNDLHIRPKNSYIGQFYNECDNFEKLLMNPKTTPRYTATFSVIKENDFGYYRELETFTFPTTYGDYNIDATDYGFNEYTNKMIEVGEFYDERFSDNIWRSMTHEAIKNFDWTYTREFEEGDEEEYVLGGERMQKALRVFAREFDEIISYIENIKSVNNVTYDERDNIPDYFLTDVVENEGWNVELIYPYELNEFYYQNGDKVLFEDYEHEDYQLNNAEVHGYHLIREFSQNSTTEVKPYANELLGDYKNGYFIVCCVPDDATPIEVKPYNNTKYSAITANESTYYDECAFGGRGVLKNRIRSYSDEKTYSYKDVNNEFLRRLKINSKPIWRHKGTIEGIEMILGIFGLRSKRFDKDKYNYELVEYTSFAPYINDWWDAVHQMYRIDWINSTKAINYVDNGVEYVSYQGIPVAYKEIENSYINRRTNSSTTTDSRSAYTRSDGSLVLERRLYPNFNKGEQYDGNPYFQMDGGWLSKTIASSDTKKYNFQYDVDNNIVYTDYEISGKTDESGFTIDNEFLYKETVRNIRRTDNVRSLLKTPTYDLTNGCVFYVTNVEENILVVDGDVFDVIDEYSGSTSTSAHTILHCVELIKDNGYIRVGDKYFDESICVYDKDWQLSEYSLNDKPDGYSVYAYLCGTIDDFKFNCSDYSGSAYSIESYTYMNGTTEDDTNYFVLDDVNYSYNIAKEIGGDDVWTSGWRRLKKTNKEYLKLNTIENYFKGNNPHNGKMVYDNGHEYYTYFKRLFKYPIENDLFDERCYTDYYYTLDDEISKYGFSGLIDDNEDIKQYDINLIEDSKIHYFGNYYSGRGEHVYVRNENLLKYGENGYTLSSTTMMIGGTPYSNFTTSDEVTNQIVNNKRLSIKFNLHYKWYTKDGQEEIKYLDTIVMNYLTQMIPSTTILDICYVSSK